MSTHPNAQRMKETFERLNAGDIDGMMEFFAEDFVNVIGGNNQLTGEYRGREAVEGQFAKIRELTGGTWRQQILTTLGDDRHAVMFARTAADRDGKHLDVIIAAAHTADAEGKWTQCWFLPNDQAAFNTFFA